MLRIPNQGKLRLQGRHCAILTAFQGYNSDGYYVQQGPDIGHNFHRDQIYQEENGRGYQKIDRGVEIISPFTVHKALIMC